MPLGEHPVSLSVSGSELIESSISMSRLSSLDGMLPCRLLQLSWVLDGYFTLLLWCPFVGLIRSVSRTLESCMTGMMMLLIGCWSSRDAVAHILDAVSVDGEGITRATLGQLLVIAAW
jgi:hypothetical protein